MATELETYDIQLNTVGAEAVQQTLDALGVKAEAVNATAAGDGPAGPEGAEPARGSAGQAAAAPVAVDLAGVLAGIERTNDLLAAILAAIEKQPPPPQPSY